MDKYTATERAYKNGYEKGYQAAKKEAESEILILKQKRANIFEIANAYKRGYENALKWIPVSERLPTEEDANEEGVVLVHNIGCPMYEAMDWDQVEMFSRTISHWMPLPEAPKEAP